MKLRPTLVIRKIANALALSGILSLTLFPPAAIAQNPATELKQNLVEDPNSAQLEALTAEDDFARRATFGASSDHTNTILTLRNLALLKNELQLEMEKLNTQLGQDQSTIEKQDLLEKAKKLNQDIKSTQKNIEEIAAGADISSLRAKDQPIFDFQQELFSLLEPAIKEMKEMTSHVREKNVHRENIDYYSSKLPTTERAIESIEDLLQKAEDPALQATLNSMLDAWKQQYTFLNSEIASASLQLEQLEQTERSVSEASEGYFKSFLQNRGRYLGWAILVVLGILLVSRLIRAILERYLPGYQKPRRSFQIRLLDLAHRVITGLLLIIGPMIVFYLAEDWLLFSLGVLVLLGFALTLRHAIPRYWQLAQLFLNIGTVREGERIEMNGLPWLVQKINFYTLLRNPTAGMTRRVKIDDLVDLRSRDTKDNESWFACRPGDWVTFDDGKLARVIGISEELTEVVLRGGAHRTYPTLDFLATTPTCISQNFRIKETIGISYSLQAESVSTVCDLLHAHILGRIEDEGYTESMLNLSVEFEYANASSLDIVVIIDFKGDAAPFHNRLKRCVQRWNVEACTKHDWEIPFMQVTLHKPEE